MASKTAAYIKTVTFSSAQRNWLLTGLDSIINRFQDIIADSNISVQDFGTLAKIQRGHLTVESAGEIFKFGQPYTLYTDGPPRQLNAVLKVLDESVWVRLVTSSDLGFADAYMLGHIDVDSLNNIFRVFILNRTYLGEMTTFMSPFVRFAGYIANFRLANNVKGSQRNISAHYDLSNEVFAAFLSWDMTYSCAIFDEEAKGCTGDLQEGRYIAPPRISYSAPREPPDDLERGQMAKLHMIIQKAKIKKGSYVLDIGCGWGSFALLAAGEYGARVEATTISIVQKDLVDKAIEEAGLSHLINVHVMDYRCMPQVFHHAFDAVISLGVMEHIGIEFMAGWFKQAAWAMKPENSVKVFTMSTMPDTRWEHYSRDVDFIRKYIFPGSQLSTVKTLITDIAAAGLNIHSVDNLGPHYARTVREWSSRFQRNFRSHIVPALLTQYPELDEDDLEIFRKKWIYYFAYSEAGFALRTLSETVVVATRESNLNL